MPTVEQEIARNPELVGSPWTDIHTHINFLERTPEETLKLCKQLNVLRLITIGTEPGDLQIVLDLAKKFYPHVSCTLGIHPHEAEKFTDDIETFIRKHAREKEVVAIGESIGYHTRNVFYNPDEVMVIEQLLLCVNGSLHYFFYPLLHNLYLLKNYCS